ncbi:hypothetical protein YC2023_032003 [Brassica napus]
MLGVLLIPQLFAISPLTESWLLPRALNPSNHQSMLLPLLLLRRLTLLLPSSLQNSDSNVFFFFFLASSLRYSSFHHSLTILRFFFFFFLFSLSSSRESHHSSLLLVFFSSFLLDEEEEAVLATDSIQSTLLGLSFFTSEPIHCITYSFTFPLSALLSCFHHQSFPFFNTASSPISGEPDTTVSGDSKGATPISGEEPVTGGDCFTSPKLKSS